ncbi:hypothetical protein AS031_08525 [Pseudarthrobacter enclensis]|uniref:Uncharacterized protein n=1 Tax=Pseudarthrobacter enclensis TaxID=993070 RepID=A0A0V8IPB9_9MICC|nr:hypothetical protein AS031_08525 [Pseudarthrobacter enclensis]
MADGGRFRLWVAWTMLLNDAAKFSVQTAGPGPWDLPKHAARGQGQHLANTAQPGETAVHIAPCAGLNQATLRHGRQQALM